MGRRERRLLKQTRNAARVTAIASVADAKYTREMARRGRPGPEPAGPKITLRSIAEGARDRFGPERPAAGWYPDPHAAGMVRYWDGDMWTTHSQPAL